MVSGKTRLLLGRGNIEAVGNDGTIRIIFATIALIALLSFPAMSATIDVTANATDALNGADGQCSLREAITNIFWLGTVA